jgi:hypothetical protein
LLSLNVSSAILSGTYRDPARIGKSSDAGRRDLATHGDRSTTRAGLWRK